MNKPVIPNKASPESMPAMHVLPAGLEFFQMGRDGNFWSVWRIRVKEDRTLEAEKVVEMTTYQLGQIDVGRRTLGFQMEQVK